MPCPDLSFRPLAAAVLLASCTGDEPPRADPTSTNAESATQLGATTADPSDDAPPESSTGAEADPEQPMLPALPARPNRRYCSFSGKPPPNKGRVDIVFPQRLSLTGCFAAADVRQPAPDLIPYEVNSELWTDGAIKDRYIVLPPGMGISFDDDGRWRYPLHTVLIKNFSFVLASSPDLGPLPVETRIMVKGDTGWIFRTYKWNETHTDAELLATDETVTLSVHDGPSTIDLRYLFPNAGQCLVCHSTDDVVFGPVRPQLDRLVNYGHTTASQLEAFAQIGVFETPLPDPNQQERSLVDPTKQEGTLEERARSYLHANCSHCHRPGGWQPAGMDMDLRYNTTLHNARICDVNVEYTDVWTGAKRRIDAGDPTNSSIWARTQLRQLGQMPPLGTVLHDAATGVIAEWIESIDTCPP
ncbi:MAG: hypothetical protein V3V08_06900 [Nannocystaceae bacterium]